MGAIAGVVLGAGASSRLGRPKQSLLLGEVTLLEQVVRNAESSSLDEVVVVLNERRDGFDPRRRGRAVTVVNPDAVTGAASSLQAGIRAVLDVTGDSVDALVVVLGDMPGVGTSALDRVVDEWRRSRPWAARSVYADGGVAHPLLFAAETFEMLMDAGGDKSVWRMLRAHADRVSGIGQRGPTPLDVDTWEDYLAVCAALGVAPQPREIPHAR